MCGSDVASMTTIAKAFSQNRGRATGLVKAMVGLSAALAANAYAAVEPALRLYVLLIAGAYVGACAVGAARLRAGDILAAARASGRRTTRRCSLILAVVGLAVFYLALQLANASRPCPPPAATRRARARCWRSSAASSGPRRPRAPAARARRAPRGPAPKAPVRSATALEAYGSADFWLLWFVCFAVCGSGTVVMNNLTQIAKAAGIATRARRSSSRCSPSPTASAASPRATPRTGPRRGRASVRASRP
ncbi:hypothetical protein JL720_510 [Aureococcus anophagefferens]|nr:hypothetical protein JL720_510 [Aureococcus anophagefferens]